METQCNFAFVSGKSKIYYLEFMIHIRLISLLIVSFIECHVR